MKHHQGLKSHPDHMPTMHSGEHVEGHARQAQEEHRKASFFHEFHADSNGSVTKLHENFAHHDRNA
jgi:hypothetical protein